MSNLCLGTGPLPAKIMIVGEAPGEQEELLGLPFQGHAGRELSALLVEAGIDRGSCYLTNVFQERPPGNKLGAFCVGLREAKALMPGYAYPPVASGLYVHPSRLHVLERLWNEVVDCQPNLIIALGNTACWALLGTSGISKLRGTTIEARGRKILPTFHPAAVLRQWDLRPTVLADLMKARREAEFPEIRRPRREVWIEPSLEDLGAFGQKYLQGTTSLAVDIETAHGQITCIGFAPNREAAIVVPFVDKRKPDYSYWQDPREEAAALRWCKSLFRDWAHTKIFQNGLYDLQYIWQTWRCPVINALHDTMILHHSLQPEMLKGLGFLGSIYTSESSWKLMRPRGAHTEKKDE